MEQPTSSPPAPSDPTAPDPRIGAVLQGRYRILSKIASGAMGVVYRGERVQLGRPVAVKFLHPWIAAQKTFLSRFENEARAMSRLGHPNCVSVIDFGVEGGPYLVMDFVTGKTLRDATQGPQAPSRALHIVRQLLAGLAHAHAQGIVHRDLKPENLILTDEAGLNDHLRILDFGLAKLRDGPAMTAGMAVGTPSYMSPEQSGAAGTVDARSDIYSVGVLLFELLAGRKPFEAQQIGELILMHREAPPPSIRALAPSAAISAALEAVVLKALSKRQEERPQSAADMAAELDATPEGGVRIEGTAPASAPAASPAPASAAPAPAVPAPAKAAAPAAKAGALPPPPAGRAPRAPEPTIVDTATAIMRRHDLANAPAGDAAASPAAADQTIVDAGAASPAPAAENALVAATPSGRKPFVFDRRLAAVVAGAVACVVIAAVLGIVRHHGPDSAATTGAAGPATAAAPSSAPAASAASAAAPAPGATPPAGSPVEEARRLRHNGDWEQALAVLVKACHDTPDDADVDYLLADIYLEHHRPLEGISAAQSAIRKNPALKGDGDLVNAVIASLASDKTYERSQAFLRGLGPAATPFLKEAAHHHANPKVRERAAEVLQGAGGQRSAFGSSQHSSSSLFHR